MKISVGAERDKESWNDYVTRHPEGTPYHRWAWREAVSAAYVHGATYLIASSRREICGVLPLINFNIPGRGVVLTSLPYCDIGGPLADTPEIESALVKSAVEEMTRQGAKALELRSPFQSAGKDAESLKVLMLLDLPAESAQLLAGLNAKLRSQIKKPLREGLRPHLGGIELLDDFYQVFARNMRDLGSPVHSRKWLRQVLISYGENARTGVIYHPDGQPLAAGIVLLHGSRIAIPWASALWQYRRLNANMLLYWTFLSFGADHGFRTFDFGRSTPGEGTYRFKEQWGAKPTPLQWITFDAKGEQEAAISRPGLLRKGGEHLWRHTPLCFCNIAGPKIRRYISL